MTETATAHHDEVGTSPEPPKPGPGHQRLNEFVGQWHTEGQQHEGPVGPAARTSAVETYEWLTGGLFLIHRFQGRVGDNDAACIEVIGHDAQTQTYPIHTFYNNGIAQQWESRESDGIWTLTGDWQIKGQAMKVRLTTVFSDDGSIMTGKWEFSQDGSSWNTFWDVIARRAS